MSSLLEEAIVDAKALKEAALKNAETAVLEKYAGEVKGALDTLLEQEELGGGPVDPSLTEFAEKIPYAFQSEELDQPGLDEMVEIDFDALKERLATEDATIDEESLTDSLELATELTENDPLDLATKLDTEEDVASLDPSAVRAPLEEDEEIALTEEMLSSLIEELVVDMNAVPEGWSSVNSANSMVVQANNEAIAAAQGAHLEEDEELEEEVSTAPDVVSADGLYESKIATLTDSNEELRALIVEAKSQLTELNLDNARLVYQNKALSSASLNERQKKQIVEAVQTANSVEEASMIFETIQNAVGALIDHHTRPQTLREAVQRPTSLLINSKKNTTATKDPTMGRMLRLAGLNK